MPTFTIFVPERIYRRLLKDAEELGISPSKLIRLALEHYYEEEEREKAAEVEA
ncbi:MAG: ribbon-helix-helix protein, CopG family [Candidatus Methanomethyliaceae archaeon]